MEACPHHSNKNHKPKYNDLLSYQSKNMKKEIYASLILLSMGLTSMADNKFKPGQTWNDTNGAAINAHGGCIQYHNGTYYWFGEYRNGNKSAGISCYSSTDMYNWKKLNLAVTPTGTMTDENRDIASGRTLERPKVIYNEKTGKWVMWIHWENGNDYGQAKVAICQADKVEGPYTLVDVFRPNDRDSRDQTLFLDTDGKAYHVYSTNMNSNTNCELLTDDYLAPTDQQNLQLKGRKYEAASLFKVGETYYGLFSGCTGWNANPGRYMWTQDLMGEWTAPAEFKASDGTTGINFCVDNGLTNTYQSQSAYVIPVQNHDKCFIYYGDRWKSSNVQSSTYVWLPLSVRSGYPTVTWHDTWDLSIFDNMYQMKRAAKLVDGMEFYFLERYSNRMISRPKSSLTLEDDGDTNLCFILHATNDPWQFKIEDKSNGKFMQSVFGTTRWQAESDDMAQVWKFELQEDGYYRLINASDGTILSVSGNSTQAGTTLYLTDNSKNIHQSFGVYFDSKAHADYEEADMYSKAYIENNKKIIEETTAIQTIDQKVDDARLGFAAGMLTYTSSLSSPVQISVYSPTSGMLLFNNTLPIVGGEAQIELVGSLQSGMYIVKATQQGKTKTLKIAL